MFIQPLLIMACAVKCYHRIPHIVHTDQNRTVGNYSTDHYIFLYTTFNPLLIFSSIHSKEKIVVLNNITNKYSCDE